VCSSDLKLSQINNLCLPDESLPESNDSHVSQVIPFGLTEPKSIFYNDLDPVAEYSFIIDLLGV
jgi:hypothetical protein